MVNTLPITSLYAAVFGLFLIPITYAVGLRRLKTRTSFLDGGDRILLRRMRSHGNFVEYVPFAVVLLGLTELNGASAAYLHGLGALLLVSRIAHYVVINFRPNVAIRVSSMIGTTAVFLLSSGYLIYAQI
ncbi:MAG: MAPEG family protein [Xanthomonadales bacterium]|nr:MAPEG family protein [Xanthomonadales bacterium]